jgi:hypothetical protein
MAGNGEIIEPLNSIYTTKNVIIFTWREVVS